jgi:hypothetical protein
VQCEELEGSIDPALILLTGVGASLHFHFNNYLHPACLCAAPHPYATGPQIINSGSLSFSGRKLFHLFRNYCVSRFRK